MDFKKVLELIIGEFNKEKVNYGLIGGFAMGLLGLPRATVDMDFLLNRDDLPVIDKILKKYGYECVYRTENISQFVSHLKIFGEIDFIHAYREISKAMLKRAKLVRVFGGEIKIKVLIPEDIIGLKLQAQANDPLRATRELSDIGMLMERYGGTLDWRLLKEYFVLFNEGKKFAKLKKKYEKT